MAALFPTAHTEMRPKLLTGRLSQQDLWVPTTVRTKCYKKELKIKTCVVLTVQGREKNWVFFQWAEVHHCCGGSEVTG